MMEKFQKKVYYAVVTLSAAAIFAVPLVSLVFATFVEILPKSLLFTFILPLLVSAFIGMLSKELFDSITRILLTCLFFAIELLLVLNLPVFVGIITRGVDLWLYVAINFTTRLTFFTAPSILLGGFLGILFRELFLT